MQRSPSPRTRKDGLHGIGLAPLWHMKNALPTSVFLAAAAVLVSGCATVSGLNGLVQAPRVRAADDRRAELRLSGSGGVPRGATLRVFARVRNPNPFGLTLSRVNGSLFLEGQEAAEVDLPLGLPLEAREETVVPIDVTLPLESLPALGGTLARAATGAPIGYRVDGTMGVKTDVGEPVFGPLTLLAGEVQVR
jgi:hypothetical protein